MKCFWWGHDWYVLSKGWFTTVYEDRLVYGISLRCKICDKQHFSTWDRSISDERAKHLARG